MPRKRKPKYNSMEHKVNVKVDIKNIARKNLMELYYLLNDFKFSGTCESYFTKIIDPLYDKYKQG